MAFPVEHRSKWMSGRMCPIAMVLFFLAGIMVSCSSEDEPSQREERFTGDAYEDLHSPYIVFDESLAMKHQTTWTTVNLGSYPQAEVVESRFSALEDYAIKPGDAIVDATLYAELSDAIWTDNETVINGTKYRRMRGEDAVHYEAHSQGHYYWADAEQYHYFRYEPVKWRILNITGTNALLLSDRALDCHRFHDTDMEVYWENSALRYFLNQEVFESMFSEAEKSCILESQVENAPNYYFGTYCGGNTKDKLFILSESEVFSTELAKNYGFWPSDGIDDSARRFKPTTYAACRGAWVSVVPSYLGNTFWFMRSSGYTPDNVTYVCEFGYLYNRGTLVTCSDAGIIPAMRIDLEKAGLTSSGTVSSTDIIQD